MLDRRSMRPLRCDLLAGGVAGLPLSFWDAAAPDEAEGAYYYAACRDAGAKASALVVSDGLGPVAAMPTFTLDYALDTPLHGRFDGAARFVRQVSGSLLDWRVMVAGSALTEAGHVRFRRGLAAPEKDAAFDALALGLQSAALGAGASAFGFKDLTDADAERFRPLLKARGFAEIRSLPVATLDLGEAMTADDYLATLSSSTRKDIRRKLRSRSAVRIEHRETIGDVIEEVSALYEETRISSEVRYGELDQLPEGYFRAMSGTENTRFVLYWAGETLVAFNLLLLGGDRLVDKFIGMRQPLARDLDLYVVSWMENVALALATGRRLLQTGQTAYREKLRFGSGLEARTIFAKHRRAPVNAALRLAAGHLAFDRWDPDLREARAPR